MSPVPHLKKAAKPDCKSGVFPHERKEIVLCSLLVAHYISLTASGKRQAVVFPSGISTGKYALLPTAARFSPAATSAQLSKVNTARCSQSDRSVLPTESEEII